MLVKVLIRGKINVMTGMHIGGSTAFSAIGAVDAPVMKDKKTGLPIIPGSSLKGKMRSLLAKAYNKQAARKPDEDNPLLTDLFGCSNAAGEKKTKSSRVIFYDMLMDNWDELKEQGLTSRTEVKFENTINRLTGVANPRQIERVVRGATFPLSLVYELSGTESVDEAQMKQDFEILKDGFCLLQYDYLGGHGSRGYGKIACSDLELDVVVGDISEETQNCCQNLLDEICKAGAQ